MNKRPLGEARPAKPRRQVGQPLEKKTAALLTRPVAVLSRPVPVVTVLQARKPAPETAAQRPPAKPDRRRHRLFSLMRVAVTAPPLLLTGLGLITPLMA